MSTSTIILVLASLTISILLGWLFNKFRILKVNYFTDIDEAKEAIAAEKHQLFEIREKYGKYLSLLTPFAISWGLFGVLMATIAAQDQLLSTEEVDTILSILFTWIVSSGILLALIPVLILVRSVGLPENLEELTQSRFSLLMLMVMIVGIALASIILELPVVGIVLLALLAIPATLSAWFAGEFYAIFGIRQFFKAKGWDYIEGKAAPDGIKGWLFKITGISGTVLALLAPVLAINSLISIFSSEEVRDSGGPIGSSTSTLPSIISAIIIFLLILGPLISVATQPAGFLELTINSELYTVLSKFDWEEFNRRSNSIQEVINLKPHPKRIMAGILMIFLSFILYVSLLAIGGIISSNDLPVQAGLGQLADALKFVEVPILLLVMGNILRDLVEEKEVFDIADLGLKEKRDVTGWTFWLLQNLYNNNYDEMLVNLEELSNDPVTANSHRVHWFKGLIYALQDDNKVAEPHFRKSVELNPKYADGWMELGVVIYFQGRLDEAHECMKKAIKLKKRSKTIWYNMGRIHDKKENYEEAAKCYRKAISLDKSDYKAWANYGGALFAQNKVDESIKATSHALELEPSDHIAKTNLAISLRKVGNMDRYQELVKDIMENHGNEIVAIEAIAHNMAINDDFHGAIAIYERIVAQNKVNPFNIQGLSQVYSAFGRHHEMIPVMEKHVEYYSDDMHAKLLLGQAYLNINEFGKAVPQLQSYLEKEKTVPEAYVKLSAALANLQRFDDAFEVLEEGITHFPDHRDINFNMGLTRALTGRGDFDQHFATSLVGEFNDNYFINWVKAQGPDVADEWIDKRIESLLQQSNQANLYYLTGIGLSAMKNYERAKLLFTKSLDADPDISIIEGIGQIYMEYGMFEEAKALFEKVLQERPSIGAYNNMGVAFLRLGNPEQGLNYLIKGHQAFPNDDFLLSNICQILLSQKNYNETIPYLRKRDKLNPADYGIKYQLGTCLALSGMVGEAKEVYVLAMDMAKSNNDEEMIAKIKEMLGHLDGKPAEE